MNNTFVIPARDYIYLKSTDGINWTSGSVGSGGPNLDVTFGNGKYVLSGWTTTYSTDDFSSWTSNGGFCSYGITYGNNLFISVGNQHCNVNKSDNGSSWTQTYGISGGATLEGITYGNNIFVGVGYTSSYKTWILISSDGSNWTQVTMPLLQCEW